jgi:hypothetical protein
MYLPFGFDEFRYKAADLGRQRSEQETVQPGFCELVAILPSSKARFLVAPDTQLLVNAYERLPRQFLS